MYLPVDKSIYAVGAVKNLRPGPFAAKQPRWEGSMAGQDLPLRTHEVLSARESTTSITTKGSKRQAVLISL